MTAARIPYICPKRFCVWKESPLDVVACIFSNSIIKSSSPVSLAFSGYGDWTVERTMMGKGYDVLWLIKNFHLIWYHNCFSWWDFILIKERSWFRPGWRKNSILTVRTQNYVQPISVNRFKIFWHCKYKFIWKYLPQVKKKKIHKYPKCFFPPQIRAMPVQVWLRSIDHSKSGDIYFLHLVHVTRHSIKMFPCPNRSECGASAWLGSQGVCSRP